MNNKKIIQCKADLEALKVNLKKLEGEMECYKLGDVFDCTWGDKDCVVMITFVNTDKVQLTLIGNHAPGTRWFPPATVNDIYKISKEEFKKFCGVTSNWTKR